MCAGGIGGAVRYMTMLLIGQIIAIMTARWELPIVEFLENKNFEE